MSEEQQQQQPRRGGVNVNSSEDDVGRRPVSEEQQQQPRRSGIKGTSSIRALFASLPEGLSMHTGLHENKIPGGIEQSEWWTCAEIECNASSGDVSPRGVAESVVVESDSAVQRSCSGEVNSSVQACFESAVDLSEHTGRIQSEPSGGVTHSEWRTCAELERNAIADDTSSQELSESLMVESHASHEDIFVRAHDGETALTSDGFLVGPDGQPLLGVQATSGQLSDRELSEAIEASLCAPRVPFFTPLSRVERPLKPGRLRDVSRRSALSIQCCGMGLSKDSRRTTKTVLQAREEHDAHKAAIRTEKVQRAGLSVQRVVDAPQLPMSGLSVSARKKHNKATRRADRKALAALRADAEYRRKEARALELRSAKRARQRAFRQSGDTTSQGYPATSSMGEEFSMFVDSGAGETFVTTAVYQALGSPPLRDAIAVADVSNSVTSAQGFGPLCVKVKNVHGKWVRVLLATRAYTSDAFGVNLFSVGAGQQLGWEAFFKSNVLESASEVIPLTAETNTWSFVIQVGASQKDPTISEYAEGSPDPLPVVSHGTGKSQLPVVYAQYARLNHFGRAGRQHNVQWEQPTSSEPDFGGVMSGMELEDDVLTGANRSGACDIVANANSKASEWNARNLDDLANRIV